MQARCKVIGKNEERWRELCKQASAEQDPKKMLELIKEINRLLDEKQARLESEANPDSR
jgi:hypothetical protein